MVHESVIHLKFATFPFGLPFVEKVRRGDGGWFACASVGCRISR